ncbi:flagellar hook capping FlgD N-terminal domain-containing protein [Duganella aceris]|jgi:flagellar basal-body rod modification protein FlgD|uniref:Basal-body rod modification protein FlgD n=1 Tax=Duganella aceris TaxID=2703883 RepID=A0ABX0FST1_9BURK|nr:flagellar hook capping FlgD N-terminal domain-containing protein [Duganella aceris]NGZ87394.1 flagellar basal body rod modification protein [Duganella aceris]
MTVSLLNNNGGSGSADTGTSVFGNSASETSDMFTKLLVAQIRNQDPLSPTDPAQFVQQLTQLSQTESLQSLTSVTTASASALSSLQVMALGAQVGADLMITTKQVVLDGGTKVSGQTELTAASSATKLVLTGSDGVRHETDLGTQPPGPLTFSIDPAKLGLPAGTYAVEVTTSSKETPSIDIQGRLNNVRLLATGAVQLNVSNIGNTGSDTISAFNGKSASATQSVL